MGARLAGRGGLLGVVEAVVVVGVVEGSDGVVKMVEVEVEVEG